MKIQSINQLKDQVAVVILAAGKGKRMESKIPKVFHTIGNHSIIEHTLEKIKSINPSQIVVVASPEMASLSKKLFGEKVDIAIQKKPLGTADATLIGIRKVKPDIKTVLVVYGADLAFFQPQTLIRVIKQHMKINSLQTLITAKLAVPGGLGRIIREDGKIVDIIEEKDASISQRKIKEINVGIYVFEKKWLKNNLSKIKPSGITGEKYLVDLVKIAIKNKQKIGTYQLKDTNQWLPIDSQKDLELAQAKIMKNIHIMGIAGAGASAVAQISQSYGYIVSGCDLNPDSSYTKNFPILIKKGHNPEHLLDTGMLIVSPAILKFDPDSPELNEARNRKIPILTWQQFQAKFLQKGKFTISVAGAYGKSTTTAMIAKILTDYGLDPTCEVGATLLNWKRNFKTGKSKYYVCEADEYNDNFLNYESDIAVVLDLAWDHPDYFKNKKEVLVSYKKFIGKIKKEGTLVINDKSLNALKPLNRNNIKIVIIKDFPRIKLSIIGDFRKENANAALTTTQILRVSLNEAKKSLATFKGLARRLEYKGEIRDTKIYDDYAVQPYTIKTTANALCAKFKSQKMALILEPHTFSRLQTFFEQFTESLKEIKAQRIFITNVYAAREHGNSRQLAESLSQKVGPRAKFSGSVEDTAAYLKKHLDDFDIILSMGAGDIYRFYELLRG